MKIIEAINYIDELKPNGYSQPMKVRWLSLLEGKIMSEIIGTTGFAGYDDDTPLDTELTVSYPYDEVYTYWLEAQIDYANGEYPRYNNSMAMFNTAYSAFERYHNRTNVRKGTKLKFF